MLDVNVNFTERIRSITKNNGLSVSIVNNLNEDIWIETEPGQWINKNKNSVIFSILKGSQFLLFSKDKELSSKDFLIIDLALHLILTHDALKERYAIVEKNIQFLLEDKKNIIPFRRKRKDDLLLCESLDIPEILKPYLDKSLLLSYGDKKEFFNLCICLHNLANRRIHILWQSKFGSLSSFLSSLDSATVIFPRLSDLTIREQIDLWRWLVEENSLKENVQIIAGLPLSTLENSKAPKPIFFSLLKSFLKQRPKTKNHFDLKHLI